MNSNQQEGFSYIDTGFPYAVTESFMDFFDGTAYVQADSSLAGASLQDQGSMYWSMMHSGAYRYGYSGSASNSFYSFNHTYEVDDQVPTLGGGRRAWDAHESLNVEELPTLIWNGSGNADACPVVSTEECIQNREATINHQLFFWQDNIDPDSMSYEELLDLGEAVGTQSRGLTQELISKLPVSKYKCNLFSRKKTHGERCVICQMEYKRGDRQMTLPCKHVYHAACSSRWLGINKACPVCFAEVSVDKLKR